MRNLRDVLKRGESRLVVVKFDGGLDGGDPLVRKCLK